MTRSVQDVLDFAAAHPVHPETRRPWLSQSSRFFTWATKLYDPEVGFSTQMMPSNAIQARAWSINAQTPIYPDAYAAPAGSFHWWGGFLGDVAMALDGHRALAIGADGTPKVESLDALLARVRNEYFGWTDNFCGVRVSA